MRRESDQAWCLTVVHEQSAAYLASLPYDAVRSAVCGLPGHVLVLYIGELDLYLDQSRAVNHLAIDELLVMRYAAFAERSYGHLFRRPSSQYPTRIPTRQ